MAVHLVCQIPKEDLFWVETLGINKFFPWTFSLEIFSIRYREYAGLTHFWTSAFLTWMWILSNLFFFFQRKNNIGSEIDVPAFCAFTLCWQINCLFYLLWTVRLCSVCWVTCISLHYTLETKGSFGVKMNAKMSKGFGLSSVTQTRASHWSWQSVLWHNGKDLWQAMWIEANTFSKGYFIFRLCGVIFKFAHSLIFKFCPDSPVSILVDGITA